MRLRHFAEAHPYWFVAGLEIGIIVVYLIAGTVAYVAGLDNLGLYGLAQVILSLIAVLLLTAMRWWQHVGYRRAQRKGDLLWFLLPAAPLLINLIPGLRIESLSTLLLITAITFMVGFVEESFFRGLMLKPLQPHGLWRAALITAVLFGLTHALNVLSGKSAAEDAAQIVYATAIGFAYAALALKFGIIWPLVLAHFLIDLTNFIQTPGFAFPAAWNLAITLGIALIFTVYGVFVMLRAPTRGEPGGVQPSRVQQGKAAGQQA